MRPQSRPRYKSPTSDNIATFSIDADGTLLATAIAVLKDHSASKVKSMLKHNQLAVNGTPSSQFDRPVKTGDKLQVNFDTSFQVFSDPRIKLVYEDDDIMVIDKNCGVLSTGTGKVKDGTVYSIMKTYLRKRNPGARVFVVHRLDRDTSGLMLLTRTAKARDVLVKNWTSMVTCRHYMAVVEGAMEETQGKVRNYLADSPDNNYEVVASDDPKAGQLAVTNYVTLKRASRNSLVQLEMRTGRKNQMRVHMAGLGHPVVGDRKYGARTNPLRRLALHASTLEFIHPVSNKPMHFTSEVPSAFLQLVE